MLACESLCVGYAGITIWQWIIYVLVYFLSSPTSTWSQCTHTVNAQQILIRCVYLYILSKLSKTHILADTFFHLYSLKIFLLSTELRLTVVFFQHIGDTFPLASGFYCHILEGSCQSMTHFQDMFIFSGFLQIIKLFILR